MDDWPHGDSEMARLLRERDWAATPLGPVAGWTERLRGLVDLIFASREAMFVTVGSESFLIYNDGYASFLAGKHPEALGAPFRSVFAEIWDNLAPLVDATLVGHQQVMVDQHFPLPWRHEAQEGWFTATWTPVRDGEGEVVGFLASLRETTDQVRLQAALRQSEERQSFLLTLAAALRPLADPTAIQGAATTLLRERFDAGWCYYVEWSVDGRAATVLQDATREGLPSLAGEHDVSDVPEFLDLLRTGEVFNGPDYANYKLLSPQIRSRYTGLGFRSMLGAPLVKDGQLVATLLMGDTKVREWSDGAIALIQETAELTWAAVERGRAEAALRESEAQFQQLAGAVDQVFHVVDLDAGRLLYVSPAYERIWGRPAGPILEDLSRFTDTIHPEDRAWLAAAQACPLDEQGGEVEYRILRPDGEVRWIRDRVFPVLTHGSVPGRRVGVAEDITERRKAQVALQEFAETLEQRVAERTAEREALARIVETTGASVQALDLGYRWTAINEASAQSYERLYGVRPRVGSSLRELLADRPEEWTAAQAVWDRALGGESYSETAEWGDAERERRVYEMRFEVLRDGAGEITGAFLTGSDVTDRVRAQAALAEAEAARRATDALYRTFFESSPEALFVIGVEPDGGFVVEEINPAHEASLGLRIDDIRGKSIDEVLAPDVVEQVKAHYRRVTETGDIEQWREVYELGGEAQHWDSSLVPLKGSDGRIERLLGSSRNVTRQVATEEALRQSQKMEAMGQLTGGVAHDFNNLLTPIVAVLDRLRRRSSDDEREQRLVEGAAQSAERARMLVQRLLAFARRQPLQPTAVDVGSLLGGMADLVASTTGPQIRLNVEVAPDLPPARSDANQLEMAILNLAVNARDAMPEGGMLRLSAMAEAVRGPDATRLKLRPGRYVRLSVADTGKGMDEATLARAVEPFFSTKGVGQGTGLGLSMVHGLASQLGGALEIRSRPGLGTHVELWLPESRETAEAAPAAPVPEPVERRGTALLVDDEEAVRLSTADMLAELGYQVAEAASAKEALGLVQDGAPFDLLLTDHLMPGMSGSDLARRLRALRPSLPVLIISGYAESEGIEPDLPRLSKPFRKDELEAALAEMMSAGSA